MLKTIIKNQIMKKLIIYSLIFFLFVSCKKLTVGESYQGGKIAYIDASGKHGLIAAPSDQSTSSPWGCAGTPISGADGTAIGTGCQNTIDIMNGCSTPGIAARICGDLVLGGYSDWYLPSKDELNQLYINRVSIGGFTGLRYWMSKEQDNNLGALQDFGNGNLNITVKNSTDCVRAVRSF